MLNWLSDNQIGLRAMSANQSIQVYLSHGLMDRLDRYGIELRKKFPGVNMSRSKVVKILVEEALKQEEKGEGYL